MPNKCVVLSMVDVTERVPERYWIVYRDYDYYYCGDYVVGPVALEQDKFGIPYFITDEGVVYYEILKRFDTEFEAEMWNRASWWKRLWWKFYRPAITDKGGDE